MVITTKHIRELLAFFKEVRIFSFENCHNIVKQISSSLEIEIKFKQYHSQQIRKYFCILKAANELINEKDNFKIQFFFVIMDIVIECINRCLELHTNYESTFSFLFNFYKLQEMSEETLKCFVYTAFKIKFKLTWNWFVYKINFLEKLFHKIHQLGILKFIVWNWFMRDLSWYCHSCKILFTAPVTEGVSEERFLSKLKIINNFCTLHLHDLLILYLEVCTFLTTSSTMLTTVNNSVLCIWKLLWE